MPTTSIPIGDPRAVKVFSVALFNRVARKASFRKRLTGPVPKQAQAEKQLREETSHAYPIVEIRDLSKTAGERVSVDIVDIINGTPVMGDRNISGKMMGLEFSTDEIRIDQYRGGVDPGGRMTQQRTTHNLRGLALAALEGWSNRVEDELCFVHLAGARGYQTGRDWNIPLEAHPEFSQIVVNDVEPPTNNRRFVPGSTDNLTTDIDSSALITLNALDDLRTRIDESDYPLQGIVVEGMQADEEDPLYVLYLTSRQWNQMQQDTSTQNWRQFMADANTRAHYTKHPLFMGNAGYWRGIIVRVTRRAIRFPSGSVVNEYDAAGSLGTDTAGVDFDRGILMGAQAMAKVYGRDAKSKHFWRYHEEETDHGNRVETSVAMMGGCKKLRFEIDGQETDHGVWAVDSYAPAV